METHSGISEIREQLTEQADAITECATGMEVFDSSAVDEQMALIGRYTQWKYDKFDIQMGISMTKDAAEDPPEDPNGAKDRLTEIAERCVRIVTASSSPQKTREKQEGLIQNARAILQDESSLPSFDEVTDKDLTKTAAELVMRVAENRILPNVWDKLKTVTQDEEEPVPCNQYDPAVLAAAYYMAPSLQEVPPVVMGSLGLTDTKCKNGANRSCIGMCCLTGTVLAAVSCCTAMSRESRKSGAAAADGTDSLIRKLVCAFSVSRPWTACTGALERNGLLGQYVSGIRRETENGYALPDTRSVNVRHTQTVANENHTVFR